MKTVKEIIGEFKAPGQKMYLPDEVEAIAEMYASQPKWIDVNDRPKSSGKYIVMSVTKEVHISTFYITDNQFIHNNIIKWQPIPSTAIEPSTEEVKHWYAKTKHTEWRQISDEEFELTKHLARFEFKNE